MVFGSEKRQTAVVVACPAWESGKPDFGFPLSHPGHARLWECGISRLWRDSQGAVERGEKLLLLFHAFHGPGISIALPVRPHAVSRASGDSDRKSTRLNSS